MLRIPNFEVPRARIKMVCAGWSWLNLVLVSILVCHQLDSTGARSSLFDSTTSDSQGALSSRCSMWTPRERRHPNCLTELQQLADGLTSGVFGPPGAYNSSTDLAPERDWEPSDPALNRLYKEYGARRESAGRCLQGHSVFFVGR